MPRSTSSRGSSVDAVAVTLLFAYLRPEHELRVGERLRERLPGVTVSLSHEVAPIWREYERSVTTIADAYLKPLLGSFVESPRRWARRGAASAGAAACSGRTAARASADEAASRPVELSLSGLAGGVIGGCALRAEGADI